MIEEIRFLEMQGRYETHNNAPSSLPPYLNSLLPYLRRCELPSYLAELHLNGNHSHDFDILHRLIFEIMSKFREHPMIRDILHHDRVTPFMLKTVPYSSEYVRNGRDQFIIACAGIRQLINQGITAVKDELKRRHADIYFLRHYRQECTKRDAYDCHNEFPSSFYLRKDKAPRLPYPGDLKLDATKFHPFIHPFEHDFLTESAHVFKSSPIPKVRELSIIITKLLGYRFEYQLEMSQMFTMGFLDTAGKVAIFADDFDHDMARDYY